MDIKAGENGRAEATRLRLLDAAEALVADHGYGEPSHRAIAGRAGVHVGLLNYHFGSKDMLFEAVVARRADQLIQAWTSALHELRGTPFTPERVLHAYWAPFSGDDAVTAGPWRNYLCAIARLSQADGGELLWNHGFSAVETMYRNALAESLPRLSGDAIEQGFRYARKLLDAMLLQRCDKSDGACEAGPVGMREQDVDGLIAFLAAGMEAIPIVQTSAHASRIVRTSAPTAKTQ